MSTSFFDIFIVVIFVYFCVSGLIRGFCKEAFSLVGLIGGIWLAYTYYPVISPYFSFINSETWRTIAAYFVIFLGVNFVTSFLAILMQGILNLAMLPWADKLAGFVLGFGKSVLLCSVVVLVTQHFFGNADFLKNSLFLPYMTNFVESVRAYIPNDFFNFSF